MTARQREVTELHNLHADDPVRPEHFKSLRIGVRELAGLVSRLACTCACRRLLTVLPLCYRCVMAVRKKRSISIPPELDAEIAAAARADGMSYSAWLAQTAQKEFTIRAGLEAVSQYEAEHGPFTSDEIAQADEWAARVIQPPATRRSA